MQEKEDLEAQMKAAEQNAAALQVDLDRTRSQAGDALRTLDTERQQLTAALRRCCVTIFRCSSGYVCPFVLASSIVMLCSMERTMCYLEIVKVVKKAELHSSAMYAALVLSLRFSG